MTLDVIELSIQTNNMTSISSWQCGLHNSKERDNALFLNERLSDLTISFPLHNISFPAHRLVMAKTSPYFENLFYGPMKVHDTEWKVNDNDIDPEVFRLVLAHCYDLNLLEESLEITLQVYKLADFYMIDSLKSQCLTHLCDVFSSGNILDHQYILEWSSKYGFSEIEEKVFEGLSTTLDETKFSSLGFPIDKDIHKNFSNILLKIPLEKHKELLNRCKHIDILIFEESWRQPEKELPSEVLLSIMENSSCKNTCEKEISILKGCISPTVLLRFINIKRCVYPITCQLSLYLSLIDLSHSQALYDCVKNEDENWKKEFMLYFKLHIQCNRISPKSLRLWASEATLVTDLYLSDVDDQSVPWVVAAATSIASYVGIELYFPRSSLSLNGFKTLITSLKSSKIKISSICIFSCNMKMEDVTLKELNIWPNCYLKICETNEDLDHW